nr:hypothetical protein BaRGS_018703 [Batillaria attramentaria]
MDRPHPPGKLVDSEHIHKQTEDYITQEAGFEPADFRVTVTVPTEALRPLLASKHLAFHKSFLDRGGGRGGGSRFTFQPPAPGVEIVKLDVREKDNTNSTVIVTLRALKGPQGTGHDPGARPLTRAKRSYRSYGMNSRIRTQMLAHRLSISYRHVQPCDYADRFYCMNGGTCVFVGALDIKTCR